MGLLDFANTPEGMQGLSLLAAAGPSMQPMNLASRIALAGDTYRGLLADQTKQKYLNAQIENLGSEAETRKAALAKQQAILDLFKTAPSIPGGSMMTAQPGQLGSGSFGVVPPPAGAPAVPQAAPTGGSMVGSLSPDKLAQLKLLGVDLTDVYKLTQPDIQVSNGYAYDRRTLKPGFLPQVNVSQNGQATLVQPDANGGVSVTMPKGSLEAYSAFRGADEAAKAGADLVKVVGPDGAERYVSRAQVLNTQPAPQRATMTAQPGDADRFAILTQELEKAQKAGNQRDVQAITAEINRLPASARTANNPSGLAVSGAYQASPTTAQAASRAAAVKQAEQNVRPAEQRQNEVAAGNYMLSVIDRALQHPGLSAATGLQGLADPRNYIPGTEAKDFQSLHDQLVGNTFLQAYANLKGGGQITEVEGAKAQNAIARLNRAQSTEAYKAALNDLREVVSNGLTRSKGTMEQAGMPGSFPGDNSNAGRPNLVAELPKVAPKGSRARDTQSGQIMVFNGLSWVPEKK